MSKVATPSLEKIAPELMEKFRKQAELKEKKLAQSASQEWLHRRRVPTTRIASLFKAGLPLGAVVVQTALYVLEGWIHELRLIASKPEMIEFLQGFVHGDDPGKLAPGPLREALRRAVPPLGSLRESTEQWDFLDEVLTAMELEERFEPSPIHSPPQKARKRPAYRGAVLPNRMGRSMSDFTRGTMQSDSGFRDTGALMSSWSQGRAYRRTPSWAGEFRRKEMGEQVRGVPGPGHYSESRLSSSVVTPKRAEFASVGLPRSTCFVTSLSQRARFKE